MAKRRQQTEQTGVLTKGGAVGAVVMIFIAVFVCIVAITLLYLTGSGSLNNKNNEQKETEKNDGAQIEEHLNGLFPEELEYLPTPELSDAEAFEKYNTKTTYYRECTVVRSDGTNKVEQRLCILREGDLFNVKVIESDSLVETLISDGTQAYIVNEITGDTSVCPLGGEFTLENLVGLTDHREIAALVSDYSAGGERREQTGLASLSLSMFRNKASNMLVINLSKTASQTREVYYYYLDYGYIHYTEITRDGAAIFSMNTTLFTADISEYKKPDSFIFPK